MGKESLIEQVEKKRAEAKTSQADKAEAAKGVSALLKRIERLVLVDKYQPKHEDRIGLVIHGESGEIRVIIDQGR